MKNNFLSDLYHYHYDDIISFLYDWKVDMQWNWRFRQYSWHILSLRCALFHDPATGYMRGFYLLMHDLTKKFSMFRKHIIRYDSYGMIHTIWFICYIFVTYYIRPPVQNRTSISNRLQYFQYFTVVCSTIAILVHLVMWW